MNTAKYAHNKKDLYINFTNEIINKTLTKRKIITVVFVFSGLVSPTRSRPPRGTFIYVIGIYLVLEEMNGPMTYDFQITAIRRTTPKTWQALMSNRLAIAVQTTWPWSQWWTHCYPSLKGNKTAMKWKKMKSRITEKLMKKMSWTIQWTIRTNEKNKWKMSDRRLLMYFSDAVELHMEWVSKNRTKRVIVVDTEANTTTAATR